MVVGILIQVESNTQLVSSCIWRLHSADIISFKDYGIFSNTMLIIDPCLNINVYSYQLIKIWFMNNFCLNIEV